MMARMRVRTGIGWDSHRLEPGRPLILGGVTLEHPDGLGLAGHSDADVLTHAVIDALLGAAGLGDIGTHFPDTDERWRGADSIELLRAVAAHARRARPDGRARRRDDRDGAPEGSARASTRCATASPRRSGSPTPRVNVKATTGEGMGFVGRGEGVAALAVATLTEA